MKQFLITGGNSFIARSIKDQFNALEYLVYSPTRKELDITKFSDLEGFFHYNDCDNIDTYLIHTGYSGTSRNTDTQEDCINNIKMLQNLLYFSSHYNQLVLFSSGAEFNRAGNIFNAKEGQFDSIPLDYYGNFKYLQTQLVKNNPKVINLRIFNCYGELENKDRFISTCIRNCLKNEDIIIPENRFFSFFYVGDLYKVIDYLIKNPPESYFELNLVYQNDIHKLSDIASMIKILTKSQSNIIIHQETSKSYHGNGDKLYNLGLDLYGIKQGILNCIKYIKKNEYI